VGLMIAVHGDAGRAKRERTKAPISALQRDCEKNTKGKEQEKGEHTLTPWILWKRLPLRSFKTLLDRC
jgi:hypothetical protein